MNRGIRTQQQECDHEWSDKGYCKRCDADRPDEVVEEALKDLRITDEKLTYPPTPQQECCTPIMGYEMLKHHDGKCPNAKERPTPQQECEHGVKLTDKELRELIDKLEYPPQQVKGESCQVGCTDPDCDKDTPQQTTLRERVVEILYSTATYTSATDAILELIEDVAIGAENTGKTNERAWIKEAVEGIGSIEKSYRSEAEAIAYTEGIDAMYNRVLKILDA